MGQSTQVGVRTCSGRTPMPMSGLESADGCGNRPRTSGDERRLHRGGGAQNRADDAVLDQRVDPLRWRAWATPGASALDVALDRHPPLAQRRGQDVGGGRRRLDREVMPTPATGDIAWAASPMQSRPGRYRGVSRFTARSGASPRPTRISPHDPPRWAPAARGPRERRPALRPGSRRSCPWR